MCEENPLITKSGTDVSFHFSRFTHKENDAMMTIPALYGEQPSQWLAALSTVVSIENKKNAFCTKWLHTEALVISVWKP